jgi:hypothetical protein
MGKMELLNNRWGLPANIYSILGVFHTGLREIRAFSNQPA